MNQRSQHVGFFIKVFSIGFILLVCFAASLFVQSVVNDRMQHQETALENRLGNTSQVLINGAIPGFDSQGISIYRLVDRALKYAILFIALTFLSFFLMEVLNKLRLHPMQYLLVGLGLAEFYLLLLALMEHIGFLAAYLIAATLTILLITLYSRFVLHSKKSSLTIGALLVIIYTYLFITLRLEFYALLSGALLLFLALTLVMYLTRELDWFSVFEHTNGTTKDQ